MKPQDELLFADEADAPLRSDPSPAAPEAPRHWHVLVVDDDQEVQAVTQLALSRLRFKGRSVELHSALSSTEAAEILRARRDIAVVLLDVVMESEDAGLRLVRTIREEIGNTAIRIVLRTGQPGQAPEESVILEYDINDYKSKTELTSRRLFTTMIAALRAWDHIVALEASREGLRQIIDSTDSLFRLRSMRSFAAGVLSQLSALLDIEPSGIFCVHRSGSALLDPDGLIVLAAAGPFQTMVDRPLREHAPDPEFLRLILQAMEEGRHVFQGRHAVLHIAGADRGIGGDVVACVETDHPLSEVDLSLVELFASKILTGLENVAYIERLTADAGRGSG